MGRAVPLRQRRHHPLQPEPGAPHLSRPRVRSPTNPASSKDNKGLYSWIPLISAVSTRRRGAAGGAWVGERQDK